MVKMLRHSIEKRLVAFDSPSTDSDHEDSPESESEEEDETSGNFSDEEVRQYTKS